MPSWFPSGISTKDCFWEFHLALYVVFPIPGSGEFNLETSTGTPGEEPQGIPGIFLESTFGAFSKRNLDDSQIDLSEQMQ